MFESEFFLTYVAPPLWMLAQSVLMLVLLLVTVAYILYADRKIFAAVSSTPLCVTSNTSHSGFRAYSALAKLSSCVTCRIALYSLLAFVAASAPPARTPMDESRFVRIECNTSPSMSKPNTLDGSTSEICFGTMSFPSRGTSGRFATLYPRWPK